MLELAKARERMVQRQLAWRGVSSAEVLRAMREVPREVFLPEGLREFAYADAALPIEAGQTISQPFIVALMIEAAEAAPGRRVMEIGAGSGYAAAVLSRIAGKVYAVERLAELAAQARRRMEALHYDNVEICVGDGSRGLPEAAPFGAILVSAGGPAIPQGLKAQLDIGGVLVMPVGDTQSDQRLIKMRRRGAAVFEERDLGPVNFVPLIGADAWRGPEGGPADVQPRVAGGVAQS